MFCFCRVDCPLISISFGSSSGRASALGSGGRGFDTRLGYTKGIKKGTSGYLASGAQHYKASTGFSSSNIYIVQLTSHHLQISS